LVLRGAIVFWYEDRGAPIAFRLAANIAHDPIDRDAKRISSSCWITISTL